MVELVVAENCFHVLRVKCMEMTRVEIVECNEVLTLAPKAKTLQKICSYPC